MILPEKYQGVIEEELKKRIQAAKEKAGEGLVILGHHYQRDDVFNFADFTGDSFKLAQDAARQKKAKYIVFCGVHFMAEAARIVCSKEQCVFLPDLDAGCPMADMAPIDDVEVAWEALSEMTDTSKVIPITYMNSTAGVKAFCGKTGGIVCTSSNAGKLFKWAFERGEKIFFLPDQYLGQNSAHAVGLKNGEIRIWEREKADGGLTNIDVEKAKVIVWSGFCHVHTHFTVEHVMTAREKYPGCKVIVHPECPVEVVNASDAVGSTEQIKGFVDAAAAGSTIVIGTEINMVNRLGEQNKDKKVIPLSRSLCPNMFKISLNDLCWTLEELGSVGEIFVDDAVQKDAKAALQRMLENG